VNANGAYTLAKRTRANVGVSIGRWSQDEALPPMTVNTALVSLITITDLTFIAQILRADTLRTEEIFTMVLIMYFLVALLITVSMRLLERKVSGGLDHGGIR